MTPSFRSDFLLEDLAAWAAPRRRITLDAGQGAASTSPPASSSRSTIVATVAMAATLRLAGGGRYDDLATVLGARERTPACGFAYGLERIVEALAGARPGPTPAEATAPDALVCAISPARAPTPSGSPRRAGEGRADRLMRGRGVRANLEAANRRGIPHVAIVGEPERRDNAYVWRDMAAQAREVRKLEGVMREGDPTLEQADERPDTARALNTSPRPHPAAAVEAAPRITHHASRILRFQVPSKGRMEKVTLRFLDRSRPAGLPAKPAPVCRAHRRLRHRHRLPARRRHRRQGRRGQPRHRHHRLRCRLRVSLRRRQPDRPHGRPRLLEKAQIVVAVPEGLAGYRHHRADLADLAVEFKASGRGCTLPPTRTWRAPSCTGTASTTSC